MKISRRVFVAAWEYLPIVSGESIVCSRTLENSYFDYDVCCGNMDVSGNDHVRLYPVSGPKYLWWPFAVAKKFEMLCTEEHYSVMMSRVMPPNGHFAGWLIKKRHSDVAWIAYFSDPVWNSPFIKLALKDDGSHGPKWLLMKIFGIPCKWALRQADVLMFNNERLARYVLGNRYEELHDKLLISPYGHDGIRPRPIATRNDKKFRITHVGQIYGARTFETLVNALSILKENYIEVYEQIELCQVGFVCEAERLRVEKSNVLNRFTFIGTVSYKESIEEMYQADCLLVIDPIFDSPDKNVYIPGKIYDYFSTARPILCIAEESSATGDIARLTGCALVRPAPQLVAMQIKDMVMSQQQVDIQKYATASCRTGISTMDQRIKELMSFSSPQTDNK